MRKHIYTYMYKIENKCIHIDLFKHLPGPKHIFMYKYMHIYICIYVLQIWMYTFIYMYICIYTYIYIYMYIHNISYICIHIHIHIYIYIFKHLPDPERSKLILKQRNMCVYICLWYTHICIYIHNISYIYICTYVYIYIINLIYIYTYMYTFKHLPVPKRSKLILKQWNKICTSTCSKIYTPPRTPPNYIYI
jgi:hypothetical protein